MVVKRTEFDMLVRSRKIIENATGTPKNFSITPANVKFHADAIANFMKEYVEQAGAGGVVLGNSGGLDSATLGALASRANISVYAIAMPHGSSMKFGSLTRATEVAEKFGWALEIHNIRPAIDALGLDTPPRTDIPVSPANAELALINTTARIRTDYLRARAQQLGYLVLGTDNLSEYIPGHFTKDGNGCDLRPCLYCTKPEMYVLAREVGVIQSILDATPTAELFVGKSDEDELGFTYDNLEYYIFRDTSGNTSVDNKISQRIESSQHKRNPPPFYNGHLSP